MLENYLRKLSLIYLSLYGRISAVVGLLVVVLGSIYPVIFPIFLAVIIVLNMLPVRDEHSLVRMEFLEQVDDLGQVGGGFLNWLPIVSLITYAVMTVVIEGGFHSWASVQSIGPFSHQITSFCNLAHSVSESNTCSVNGYTVVSYVHVVVFEWIIICSFIYMSLSGYFQYMACKFKSGNIYNVIRSFVVAAFGSGFFYASLSAGQTLYLMLIFQTSPYNINEFIYGYNYVNSIIFWSLLVSLFVYGSIFTIVLLFVLLSKQGLNLLRRDCC